MDLDAQFEEGFFGGLCKKLGLPVWIVLAAAGFVFYKFFLKRK